MLHLLTPCRGLALLGRRAGGSAGLRDVVAMERVGVVPAAQQRSMCDEQGSIEAKYANFDLPYSAAEIGLFRDEDIPGMDWRRKADLKRQLKEHIMMHVKLSMNNTLISISDVGGRRWAFESAGTAGFKNTKQSQAVPAYMAGREITRRAIEKGIRTVSIRFRGIGRGREPVMRAVREHGLMIKVISDVTHFAFNGGRPKKARKV